MTTKTKIKKLRTARSLIKKAAKLLAQVEAANGMTGVTGLYSEVIHAEIAIDTDIQETKEAK